MNLARLTMTVSCFLLLVACSSGRGVDGAAGSTGVTGPAGTVGPAGATGLAGAPGNTGASGPMGSPGLGVTWKGAWDGVTVYAVNDAVESGGSSYIALDMNSGNLPPSAHWSLFASSGTIGHTGIQGSTGATGASGVSVLGVSVGADPLHCPTGGVRYTTAAGDNYVCNGTQGLSGAQGIQGIQGNQGPIGPQGVQGLAGADGARGLQGLVGPTGSQGAQGSAGSTGAQGVAGNQGIQGSIGPTGALGAQGSVGPTGSQGIQGVQGIPGTTGAQGVQGLIGTTGLAGVTGATGSAGTTGATGAQGSAGLTGATGVAGATGLVWKGLYSPNANYAVNDGVITSAGSAYIALAANTANAPPGAAWSQLASGGATGATGAVGSIGATGATGQVGAIGATGAKGQDGVDVIGFTLGLGDPNCNYGGTRLTTFDGQHYVCNGDQGAQGIKGATGSTGGTGLTGATGTQGTAGTAGATGSQGIQGATGATGAVVNVTCPAGQAIQGISANGTPICIVGGYPVAPLLVNGIGNVANVTNSAFGANAYSFIPGFVVPFVSAGGPVVVTPNLTMNAASAGGSTITCRPVLDGVPAGVFAGYDITNIWSEGLQSVFSSEGWRLWSATRGYTGIPTGQHTMTLQCTQDSANSQQVGAGTVEVFSVIPYGPPATSEVKAYTSNVILSQTVTCCSMGTVTGLSTLFNYQGGPVRVSLAIPLIGGSHSFCAPFIDGSPAAAEPVDNWTSNPYNEGLVYTAAQPSYGAGWEMWSRTRIYDPTRWATPLTIGLHNMTVQCGTDSGTVSVGTGSSAGNLTVVTYQPPAAGTTTVHAYTATSATYSSVVAQNWASDIAALSTNFTSKGGPVEVGVSIPVVSGSTASCSPLVDGAPISGDAASEPDDFNKNFWNEGLLTNPPGQWHMWNRVRMYRGITAGTHTLTLRCRTDAGTLQAGRQGGVSNLWAVAYDQ